MHRALPFVLLSLVLAACQSVCLSGCARPGATPTSKMEALKVAAASDLQRVLPRLAERFQATQGIAVTITLDASGRLAEQIRAGAPYDVFLSANEKFVRDLAREGLILEASVRPYATGTLVLCLHPTVGARVRGLADLAGPEIHMMAIANPDYAPYGVAARQALERAGLWKSLEPRIVRADSVRQALVYVQEGHAEAALVSRALLGAQPGVHVIDVSPDAHDPLIQSLGIVADSRHRDHAEAFARFLTGAEGQSILSESGFQSPTARPPAAPDTRTGEPGNDSSSSR